MKLLTREEAFKLGLKFGRSSPVRQQLINMEVGLFLYLTKQEYPKKKGPYPVIRRLQDKTPMRFKLYHLQNGTGWAVEKLKGMK